MHAACGHSGQLPGWQDTDFMAVAHDSVRGRIPALAWRWTYSSWWRLQEGQSRWPPVSGKGRGRVIKGLKKKKMDLKISSISSRRTKTTHCFLIPFLLCVAFAVIKMNEWKIRSPVLCFVFLFLVYVWIPRLLQCSSGIFGASGWLLPFEICMRNLRFFNDFLKVS